MREAEGGVRQAIKRQVAAGDRGASSVVIRKLKRRDQSALANKIVVALFLVDGIGGSSQQNQQNQRRRKQREDGMGGRRTRSGRIGGGRIRHTKALQMHKIRHRSAEQRSAWRTVSFEWQDQ